MTTVRTLMHYGGKPPYAELDLPYEKALDLASAGVVEVLDAGIQDELIEDEPTEIEADGDDEPIHLGGGWYQLSDGSKVRGLHGSGD